MAGSRQPFVGRLPELAVMARAYARVSGGQAAIVCVEGPAGIGKTALVRAFLAATAPALVVSASADEAEASVPWGVLSQLSTGASAASCEVFRHVGEPAADADPAVTGRLLLAALRGLSSAVPAVVVVEDLQWADQESATALRFALRRLRTEPVLAMLTMRPGDAGDGDAWGRLADDRGERVRPPGLGMPEAAELIAALSNESVPWPVARRLWAHTGGNPLYIRCLLEAIDPADLAAATAPLPVPTSVATMVAARATGCSVGARDLVAAAAVLGERCPLSLATSLAGADAPVSALEEAVSARLLTETYHGGVRHVAFAHPLERAAIYFGLSPARRAALHLSAARLCTGTEALTHRVAAATTPDAALAAELAGLAATESSAGRHMSAAGHLVSAADLSADPALREDRLLAACALWLRSGAVHEVSSRRGWLETVSPCPSRDQIRGLLAYFEGRPDEARVAFQAASNTVGNSVAAGREAAAGLAGLALLDWDWQAALALSGEVPATSSRLWALIRCVALAMAGRPGDARDELAVGGAGRAGRGGVVERLARGVVGTWSDDLAGAKHELEEIASQPAGVGGAVRPVAHSLLADVYYRLGAFDAAMATAGRARSLFQEAGRANGPEIAVALAASAYAASAGGEWAVARDLVAAARAHAVPGASKLERGCAAAARWSLAVALDDPEQMLEAAGELEEASGTEELSIFPFGPVMAEALWRNGKLAEATIHLTAYESRARRLGRVSALVGAARVRGMVATSSRDPGAALLAFDEAAPAAESLPPALDAARFLAAHGVALARAGRRTAAARKMADARSILERIGAQPYVQRCVEQFERLGYWGRPRPRAGVLTAAETVVARLVASGLSNRQAAEQLMVSVKAVEFHLANIYVKLGVSSRSQLAARRDSLVAAPDGNQGKS